MECVESIKLYVIKNDVCGRSITNLYMITMIITYDHEPSRKHDHDAHLNLGDLKDWLNFWWNGSKVVVKPHPLPKFVLENTKFSHGISLVYHHLLRGGTN